VLCLCVIRNFDCSLVLWLLGGMLSWKCGSCWCYGLGVFCVVVFLVGCLGMGWCWMLVSLLLC